jgi:hypothetical protein
MDRHSTKKNERSNAPKWFAAVEMIRLAADKDWLHKATKEISKYWRHKHGRRMNPLPSPRPGKLEGDGVN